MRSDQPSGGGRVLVSLGLPRHDDGHPFRGMSVSVWIGRGQGAERKRSLTMASVFMGSSYQLDPSTLDERLQYREDYGVGGMIASQIPGIGDERQNEIDDGASFNDVKIDALKVAIAEHDENGWDIHSGCYIKVRFGAVFALYAGDDVGQGGASFELERVFANKRQVMAYLSSKPMIVLEV